MPLAQRNDPNIDVKMDVNEPLNKIGKLGREMKGLGNIFENFEKQVRASDDVDFKKTIKGVSDLQKEAKKASDGFTILKGTLTSFAGNLLSNAASKLADIAREMVSVGIETDATKTRFVALSSSVEEGVKQYESFIALSQRFGIASEPVIRAAANFKAAGFEVEKTAEFTERLIIAAGGSSEAFEGLALAFRQINTGRVDLENLNQIAERGIPIFTVLADEVGVSVSELRDLISNSKISIEQFNNAIRTYTSEGSLARKAAEETAETIKSQLTNLQTSFNNFSAAVVGYFEDDVGGAVRFAISKVDELTQKIEEFQNQQRFNQILENLDIPNRNAEGLRAAFGSGIVDAGLLAPAITPADIQERIQKLEEEKQKTQEILDLQIQSGVVSEFGLQGHRNRIAALEKQITPLRLALQIYEDSNKELEQGEETLENFNKEASEVVEEVSKLPEDFEEIRDWAEATVNPSAQLSELYGGYQEDFISAAGAADKVTKKLKEQVEEEKKRNDLLRERLGLQGGEFITAEDRVKSTGGGSGENLGDILEEEANEELNQFNSTVEEIVHNLDLVHDGFTSIADIINSAGVRELQAMNQELDNLRLRNKKIEKESNERHRKRLIEIDEELQAGLISQEEADAKKKESAELEKAEIKALRNAEIKKENDINQKSYELALQNYEFTKRLRQAEEAINATAAALQAAASNKWVEFGLIVFGGLAAIIGAEATAPPAKPAPIPYLAEGGILTSPTLFVGGEAGNEAVMPLDRLNEFINMRGENGPNFVFNIDGIIDQGNLIYTIQKAIKDGY